MPEGEDDKKEGLVLGLEIPLAFLAILVHVVSGKWRRARGGGGGG